MRMPRRKRPRNDAVACGVRAGASVSTVHRIAEIVAATSETVGVRSAKQLRREPYELLEEIGQTIIGHGGCGDAAASTRAI